MVVKVPLFLAAPDRRRSRRLLVPLRPVSVLALAVLRARWATRLPRTRAILRVQKTTRLPQPRGAMPLIPRRRTTAALPMGPRPPLPTLATPDRTGFTQKRLPGSVARARLLRLRMQPT